MNSSPRSLALLGIALFSASLAGAVSIGFNSLEDVNAAFPAGIIQGGASYRTYDSASDRIRLHAQGTVDDRSSINANAYSAASYSSSLDFFTEAKTITFNQVSMVFPGSGTSYAFAFGIGNDNTGNYTLSSGPSQSLYFMIDRNSSSLTLKRHGTTLATWSGAGYSFDSISLTLTPTTWSASVLKAGDSVTLTSSGEFATALTAATWSSFYIGMQAMQTSTSEANVGRYTDGFIGSIDIEAAAIPEPATTAIALGAGALLLCGGRRALRRRR